MAVQRNNYEGREHIVAALRTAQDTANRQRINASKQNINKEGIHIIHAERLGHIVIKVRELERSRKFYTEVLGMDVMMEIPAIRAVF